VCGVPRTDVFVRDHLLQGAATEEARKRAEVDTAARIRELAEREVQLEEREAQVAAEAEAARNLEAAAKADAERAARAAAVAEEARKRVELDTAARAREVAEREARVAADEEAARNLKAAAKADAERAARAAAEAEAVRKRVELDTAARARELAGREAKLAEREARVADKEAAATPKAVVLKTVSEQQRPRCCVPLAHWLLPTPRVCMSRPPGSIMVLDLWTCRYVQSPVTPVTPQAATRVYEPSPVGGFAAYSDGTPCPFRLLL
jgi:hypothetical protein